MPFTLNFERKRTDDVMSAITECKKKKKIRKHIHIIENDLKTKNKEQYNEIYLLEKLHFEKEQQ